MAEFTAAQASVLIVPTLGRGANSFKTKLDTQLQAVRVKPVEVQVNAQTTKALAEIEAVKAAAERDPINLSVKVDKSGFKELTRNVTEVRRKYNDLRSDFRTGITLNVKVAGMAQLIQLGPMLASVNTSAVALGQSLLLLPGIILGVGSAVATALVGTRGLTDAFKAQTKAQKDSAQAARQQADANRSVKDSTRDLNRAVKDAKRNIEDLNAQLRDAPLDEAEAMLNLQEAQFEASQKLGKSTFDQQKDQLRLLKAEADLAETRRRNIRLSQDVADANAKGVGGADAVVEAQERLTKALDDVAAKSDDVSELAQALAKLSPNAQAFVASMKSVGDMYSGLKNSVQDRLFASLGADVEGLASRSLPMLESGLGSIASAINGNLRTAIAALSTGENQGFVERIFGNTADAQRLADNAIKPLLDSLLHLGAVGTDYLPRISAALGDVLHRFDAFIDRADADGSLDTWINNGMTALTQLGNSLINIGSIMSSIAQAFTSSGGQSFGQLLENTTKKWADFLKSSEGQQKWITFFQDAREQFAQWKPLLKDIPGVLKNIGTATGNWAQMMLPFFRTAASLLRDHPGLVNAVVYAYLGWKTLTPIFQGMKTGLGWVETATNKVAKAMDGPDGATTKVGALAKAFGPQLLLGAASVLVGYFATQFVAGLNSGEQALDRANAKADELRNTLDQVTGAATRASRALIYGELQNDTNTTTGERADNIAGLRSRNVDPGAVTTAIAAGDRAKVDQLLAPVVGATPETVQKSDIWNENHEWLEEAGITPQIVADAINGKPDAIQKFKKAAERNDLGLSPDVLHGLEQSGLIDIPDLLDFRNQLPADAQEGARIRGAVEEKLNNTINRGNTTAQMQRDLYGHQTLNPAGAGLFGSDATVQAGTDGVVITMPGAISASVAEDITKKGGQVIRAGDDGPDAPLSGTLVKLGREAAKQYVEGLPQYSSGGLHGPGNGTSDSMLARVSDGEYIVRAASVAKYGPKFFDLLNAGALPGFSGGGGIDSITPLPPWESQARAALGAAGYGNDAPVGLSPSELASAAAPPLRYGPFIGEGASPAATPSVPTPSVSAPVTSPVSGGSAPKPSLWAGVGSEPMKATLKSSSPWASLLSGGALSATLTGSVPHLPGVPGTPGPGNAAAPVGGGQNGGLGGISGSLFGGGGLDLGSKNQNWGLFDFLRPERMVDFFSNLAQGVGSSLLDIGLGFLSGITGFDFKGLISPFMQIGDHFTGLLGDLGNSSSSSGPTDDDANPGVQAIIDGYPGAQSQYLGTSIYGNGAYNPAALSAAMTPPSSAGFPGMFLGVPSGQLQQLLAGMPTGGGGAGGSILTAMAPRQQLPGAGGLKPNAAALREALFAAHPQLNDIGGFRQDSKPEHPSGRALDVMIPNYSSPEGIALGDQILREVMQRPDFYGAIWRNNEYGYSTGGVHAHGGQGDNEGHFNHVHVWLKELGTFANGGLLRGPGTGTSDSILARVSHGEFVTKASSVSKYGRGLFDALNAGVIDPAHLPGFADGTPPVTQPLPPPPPVAPPPMVPGAGGGQSPVAGATGEQPSTDTATQAVGDALSGIGSALGTSGDGGMSPPTPFGPHPDGDQRATLGSAPTNLDHNLSAVSTGINSAASTVGSAIGAAIGAAGAAGGAVAPGSGAAAGAASSLAAGGAQMAGAAINGAVNILSSLLVGTASPGGPQSAGAYGAPLAPGPAGNPLQQQGPGIVNNYGDIHTANYDEFYRGQQRREAQTQAPMMPMRR